MSDAFDHPHGDACESCVTDTFTYVCVGCGNTAHVVAGIDSHCCVTATLDTLGSNDA